jgi:hypothetical protein
MNSACECGDDYKGDGNFCRENKKSTIIKGQHYEFLLTAELRGVRVDFGEQY